LISSSQAERTLWPGLQDHPDTQIQGVSHARICGSSPRRSSTLARLAGADHRTRRSKRWSSCPSPATPRKSAGLFHPEQPSCILFNSVVSLPATRSALKPKGVPMSDEKGRFRRSLKRRATVLRKGTEDSADQSEAALANSRALLKRFELRAAQDRDAPSQGPPGSHD
jgi:hypothetical protein